MTNQEIAKILRKISYYLEMDDIPFKPFAYEKAAFIVESLEEELEDIYKRGGLKALEEIPGIGEGISKKIEELLKTGKLRYYEKLRKKVPVDLPQLLQIEGLGPKKIKVLYQKLGIKNIDELEEAAKNHKIAGLFGFGEKTEKNILEGIAFVKKGQGRFMLGEILPFAEEVFTRLKNLPEVKKISLAGSIRRRKETIGDVDLLAVSDSPEKVMDFFVSQKEVVKIWGKGRTKSSIRTRFGFDIDLRIVPKRSFGAALQYFTGSKEHNIALRRLAMERGYKLNEYGVFKGKRFIETADEKDVYLVLGLGYLPPEVREDTGEIEMLLKNPGKDFEEIIDLVDYNDIKGDLHNHSNFDGGADRIEDLVEEAKKLGYQYIGIADHTKFLRIEHGLDEIELIRRNEYIDKLNSTLKNFKLLKGCEANIMPDGSIDISDSVLAKMDFVIAGVHSQFKMGKNEMTKRIIKAMENPHVDIISHPTGRLINKRDEYEIDFEKILEAAKRTGTILEINSSPYRLDLRDHHIRLAKEKGVKMIIDTDAHQKDQLHLIRFGIAQARRGWAEKKDIVNTGNVQELLKRMKKYD
jgi:DNA polymerase (family 10)